MTGAPARRPVASLALVAALPWLLAAGCDMFSTRDPTVEEAQASLWRPPTSPEIIVQNLELALETQNFNDYQRALTEDFVFRPDASDVTQFEIDRPGEPIFENWDRQVEVDTAEAIAAGADSISVFLVQFDDDLGLPIRLLKYTYALTLFAPGGNSLLEGEAWFLVRQEPNGEWFIFDWEDVANSQKSDSWGRLKGNSRPL